MTLSVHSALTHAFEKEYTFILHPQVYDKHIQEQTDILTHRKVGRTDLPILPPSKTLPLCFPVCPQDLPLSTLLTLFPCLHQGPVPQPPYVLVCLSALV